MSKYTVGMVAAGAVLASAAAFTLVAGLGGDHADNTGPRDTVALPLPTAVPAGGADEAGVDGAGTGASQPQAGVTSAKPKATATKKAASAVRSVKLTFP